MREREEPKRRCFGLVHRVQRCSSRSKIDTSLKENEFCRAERGITASTVAFTHEAAQVLLDVRVAVSVIITAVVGSVGIEAPHRLP